MDTVHDTSDEASKRIALKLEILEVIEEAKIHKPECVQSDNNAVLAVNNPYYVKLYKKGILCIAKATDKGHYSVRKAQRGTFSRLNNTGLRQRVIEVGIACLHGLIRIDNLAAWMTDVIGAWIGYGADALRHTLIRLNLLTRLWTRMFAVIKALFTPTTNERGIKPKRDIRYKQFNKKHGRSIPRNNLGQNNGYHT